MDQWIFYGDKIDLQYSRLTRAQNNEFLVLRTSGTFHLLAITKYTVVIELTNLASICSIVMDGED